ncbi:MAG: hypothetical protein ACRDU8_05985, partial [Egibacteraceae bacterium]
ASERAVPAAACVPARWDVHELQAAWRDFFWAYIVRQHRPLRPPQLAIDRFRPVWLPYHVVSAGGRRFLVDLLTRRVDPLKVFPEVVALCSESSRVPREVPVAT